MIALNDTTSSLIDSCIRRNDGERDDTHLQRHCGCSVAESRNLNTLWHECGLLYVINSRNSGF